MLNINQEILRTFLTVIDKGSFSSAARALSKAPSAISMAIANLEIELNLQLFDRSKREPVLTIQGKALESKARFLLQQITAWEAQAFALSQGQEAKLSFAIEPELVSAHWADYIVLLLERYPNLDIEVVTAPHEDAMHMLHQGRVNLAVLYERSEFDGRESFQEIEQEELIAVAAPQHLLFRQVQPIHLDLLNQHRQIVVASREHHIKPRLLWSHHYWRTDNNLVAVNLCLKGLGWCILPQTFVMPYLQAGTLLKLDIDNLTNSFPLCVDIVWSNQYPQGQVAQYLIQQIIQQQRIKKNLMYKHDA